MLSSILRREISKNPLWAPHLKAVQAFKIYLETTADMDFRITGLSEYEGDLNVVTRTIPYIHRWNELYKKKVLGKFYALEDYAKINPFDALTMLTLTTHHAYYESGRRSAHSNATIPQSFKLLKQGWHKLSDAIRKRGYSYVWILEPHRTGYPHIHVAIIGRVDEKDQKRIKTLWTRYGGGSFEHGAHFSEKSGEDSILSIRNYLMKYMIKSWADSKWTTAQLVFNALVWDNNWRMWGASKKLSKIMKSYDPEKTDIEWQKTEIKTSCYSDHSVTWKKEDTDIKPLEQNPDEILYTL